MAHSRLKRSACFIVVALAVAPLSSAAAPSNNGGAAGAWEMSLDGSHRKCRVTLGMEDLGADRALRFPAGCRRALPILNTAFGWGIDKGVIRFLDKDGQPVLTFEPQGAGEEGLIARTAVGETYLLDPKDQPAQIQRASASAASSTSERMVARFMTGPVPAPRTDPAKMPPFATVPGIYVVDRDPEREVCRVNLGIAMLEASGRYEARLLDGCRDNTLRVFDPVAWRYVAGRLTLQARQGDEVMLTLEREGQWRCTPDGGGTLVLRKATP